MESFKEAFSLDKILAGVNFQDPIVYAVFGHVLFNPLMWNIVARLEYKTKFLTRIFGGHNKAACIFNGIIIFCIGLTRDALYNHMLDNQPKFQPLEAMFPSESFTFPSFITPLTQWLGLPDTVTYTHLAIDIFALLLLLWGFTLVLAAYIRLGLIGTYLGDYFGILLPGKIEGFPFNLTPCPMYDGSSINFLAFAIMHRSIVGGLVAVFVFICYRVACIFEDSFTEKIYANAEKKKTN